MKKVAAYHRISKDDMGQDVNRQIEEVKEFCNRMDYEMVETYTDEGFARTTRNKPALDNLIKDARQRKFHLVVSDELSRFAGTPILLLNLLEELKLWNIQLCSVKEDISTDNVMGELVATMLAAISKMELFNLPHRVKSGIKNARRKNGGKWGRPSNLNAETKKMIAEMKHQKVGLKKIATETKVAVSTIRQFLAGMQAEQT